MSMNETTTFTAKIPCNVLIHHGKKMDIVSFKVLLQKYDTKN